jgi:hypothetical protein
MLTMENVGVGVLWCRHTGTGMGTGALVGQYPHMQHMTSLLTTC